MKELMITLENGDVVVYNMRYVRDFTYNEKNRTIRVNHEFSMDRNKWNTAIYQDVKEVVYREDE